MVQAGATHPFSNKAQRMPSARTLRAKCRCAPAASTGHPQTLHVSSKKNGPPLEWGAASESPRSCLTLSSDQDQTSLEWDPAARMWPGAPCKPDDHGEQAG